MKAHKTTLSVRELQKTIGQWKSRKITDSTIAKLLELMLGMTAYMNEDAVYPVENFYDISKALKFKNARYLVEAVRLSGAFGIVPGDNVYGMSSFYSYLWKEKEKTDDSAVNFTGNFTGKITARRIYIIYILYRIIRIIHPPEGFLLRKKAWKPHAISFTSSTKIRWIRCGFSLRSSTASQQKEGLAREDACANLVYLVNELLVPYFASQERFMKSTHVGRLCWLSNLLKSAGGLRMLKDATDAGRRQRVQNLADMRSEQRNNHPLCEFEWTDKESGLRFYDDPLEGMVNIPDNAPPRPGAGAEWNVLSGKWGSCEL